MKDEIQIKKTKISEIPFVDTFCLIKSFLHNGDREKILNFIEEKEKNKLFVLSDSLINTERTDWHYHLNDEFRPYYDILLKELYECMMFYSLETSFTLGKNETRKLKYSIFMLDSWFAKCRENAFVEPHHHGYGYGLYSFVCYLKIPSRSSSIKFANSDFSWSYDTFVREGDIIVFPSNLKHWSHDTEEGRSIFSGNFVWEVKHNCECDECNKIRILNEKSFNI
jgi:hypothetical protein